jgi:hypothetical protein
MNCDIQTARAVKTTSFAQAQIQEADGFLGHLLNLKFPN